MVKDLTDSIKAKLYDFAYTPFMSSFVISWILLNHKYLLIYFGNEKLETKIRLLSMYSDKTINIFGLNIWSHQLYYPVLIALGYVFIYPLFSMGFYAATLGYKNLTTKIKQKFEKKVLIDKEVENELRITIDKLQKESDDYRKDRIEMRDKYEKIEKNLNEEIQQKNKEIEEKIKVLRETSKEISSYQNEIEEYKNKTIIEQPDNIRIINSQSEKISMLKDELEKLKKENEKMKGRTIINVSDVVQDHDNSANLLQSLEKTSYFPIIQYLHDEFDPTDESTLLSLITSKTNIGRTLARKAIHDLIDDNILEKKQNGLIVMTKEGIQRIIDRVEKEEMIPF